MMAKTVKIANAISYAFCLILLLSLILQPWKLLSREMDPMVGIPYNFFCLFYALEFFSLHLLQVVFFATKRARMVSKLLERGPDDIRDHLVASAIKEGRPLKNLKEFGYVLSLILLASFSTFNIYSCCEYLIALCTTMECSIETSLVVSYFQGYVLSISMLLVVLVLFLCKAGIFWGIMLWTFKAAEIGCVWKYSYEIRNLLADVLVVAAYFCSLYLILRSFMEFAQDAEEFLVYGVASMAFLLLAHHTFVMGLFVCFARFDLRDAKELKMKLGFKDIGKVNNLTTCVL